MKIFKTVIFNLLIFHFNMLISLTICKNMICQPVDSVFQPVDFVFQPVVFVILYVDFIKTKSGKIKFNFTVFN